MLNALWNNFLYEPLYNALVFLVSIVPGGDVGIALIILTILVKLVLFPLTKKSIISQARLKQLEPEINKIKKSESSKEAQAKKTMELYKVNKVNPFSGCLTILIQLPIIIALYYVFLKGLTFDHDAVYSFLKFPQSINMKFLGLVDMASRNVVLAILAGLSQFIQVKLSTSFVKQVPPLVGKDGKTERNFSTELTKSMNTQMKYVLPVFITIISLQVSAAVALYWCASNVFTIFQEILVRRHMKGARPSEQ